MKYTILSSHFCLFQNSLIDLLTLKGSYFIIKKYKMLFCKKEEESVLNCKLIFSGLRMYFYRLWYLIWSDGCLLYFKHVSLGFDVSFHNVLKHLWSLKLVSSLRTTLWKIVLKCKIVIFISSSIKYRINLIFSVVVCICKIL